MRAVRRDAVSTYSMAVYGGYTVCHVFMSAMWCSAVQDHPVMECDAVHAVQPYMVVIHSLCHVLSAIQYIAVQYSTVQDHPVMEHTDMIQYRMFSAVWYSTVPPNGGRCTGTV